MRKLVLGLIFCFLLSALAVVAQVECYDQDEQPDIEDTLDSKAKVEYGLTDKTDECVSSREGYHRDPSPWVREYYCEGDPEQRKYKDFDCTRLGYDRCEDGACVGGVEDNTTTKTQKAPEIGRCGDKIVQAERGEWCDPPDSICYGDDGNIGLCSRPNAQGFGGCQCELYKAGGTVEDVPEEAKEEETVEEPEETVEEPAEEEPEEEPEAAPVEEERMPLPTEEFEEPKGISITRSITNGVKGFFRWIGSWFG